VAHQAKAARRITDKEKFDCVMLYAILTQRDSPRNEWTMDGASIRVPNR
jgi:hypothetical protein